MVSSHDNALSYNKAFDNGHYGIYLTGSDSNTINQNDAIHNNYYNIYLTSSDSNILTENNASLSIFDCGFFLLNSNYNTLSNNFATSNNVHGMYLQGSHNSKLTRNTVSFNFQQGIRVWSSNNNLLTDNIAYNNTQNGYDLNYSDNTTLLGNDAHNNFQNGIYLFFSNNCTILDNDIKENQQDGLNLYQSDNNTISGNTISDNVNRGVFLDDANSGSDYNTFYNNFFVNNRIHAIDETFTNDWDNAVIGNYWDNYTGVDDDNDGIGDSPHIFNGGTDYLPIWDDDFPIITIITPIYNTTVGRTALDFTIEIYDPYLDKMWYTIDGGINNVMFTGNGTIDQTLWETLWDTLSDGDLITIRFYANDTFGHLTYKEVVVIKSDPPQPTPGGIPGYDLFLFISVLFISIGIISIIAIKKRVKI